jgi:hypothetical protein
VRESEKLHIPTPLCHRVLDVIHELEAGTRKLGPNNYDELVAMVR